MPFQPDYRHMLDVLANRRPARLPIYEHIISPTIMEQMLGRSLRGPGSRDGPSTAQGAILRHAQDKIWTNSSATTAASGRR